MKKKQGIGTLLGFALFALFATSGAGAEAADRPGQVMSDVTARLTVASAHAAALEEALGRRASVPSAPAAAPAEAVPRGHDIGPGPQGGGFPAGGSAAMAARPAPGMTAEATAALDGLEAAVRDAQGLAGGNEHLEPGIAHVLANARQIRAGRARGGDATALSHEISIELFALANNARVLEAEAELRAASDALDGGRAGAFRAHLEAAVRALGQAQEKGAYHLEDDIATIQVVLARLEKDASPHEAVTSDAMEELVGDINEHLADLRDE